MHLLAQITYHVNPLTHIAIPTLFLQVVFLYAASDSSNAFRMFLLLLEFSLGPDPCEEVVLPDARSALQQQEKMPELASNDNADRQQKKQEEEPYTSLLMGLPRSQGNVYFTAGLLTCLAQKTANLAALYLSFVIIGSGESVRDVVLDTTGLFFLYDIDGETSVCGCV